MENHTQLNTKESSTKQSSTKKSNTKRFIPPTLEEVEKYCQERKNNVDPKKFFDYFSASDWVDSKGNQVRNWKQKIITWESYKGANTDGSTTKHTEPTRIGNYI